MAGRCSTTPTCGFRHGSTGLRPLVVTPDMHRVHHSSDRKETDSNYGYNLSVRDRLFGTYVDQPTPGHDGMQIGLDQWRDTQPTRLGWTLMVPLRK